MEKMSKSLIKIRLQLTLAYMIVVLAITVALVFGKIDIWAFVVMFVAWTFVEFIVLAATNTKFIDDVEEEEEDNEEL